MPDYFVFGGCLRSELPFPELAVSHGRDPNWTLKVGKLPPDDDSEILADSNLTSTCRIRVSMRNGRLRYHHSCAGTFEIAPGGREILFDASASPDLNAARSDLVSRLLLFCVDRRSATWLHGSAVGIGQSAIAFLGVSGAGKSTIALALSRAGCGHLCDDILPVANGDQPTICPSDHIIRLHGDSMEQLATGASIRRESDGKYLVNHCGESLGSHELRVPLAAIYILDPAQPTEHALPVVRSRLRPRAALPVLIQHLKLPPLLQAEDPALVMEQLGAIVAATPVFALRITRDWSALDDVVAQIIAWHSESRVVSALSSDREVA
jgi:hypothetical protein